MKLHLKNYFHVKIKLKQVHFVLETMFWGGNVNYKVIFQIAVCVVFHSVLLHILQFLCGIGADFLGLGLKSIMLNVKN